MKQKMHLKKNNLNKINKATFFGLTSLFLMSLAASSCGTFAWFIYTTRASALYDGVSIGGGQLQVGLISDVRLDNFEEHSLTEEVEGNRYIYWVPRNMNPDMINYVLSANGYATNSLSPVSSRSYSSGRDFSLYRAPMLMSDNASEPADKESYINLSLVFRYEDGLELGTYLPDINVCLTRADIRSEYNIHHAVRIFTKSTEEHLINPTQHKDGETVVGGVLDLNADGYYDSVTVDGEDKEFFYGEANERIYHSEEAIDSDSELVGNATTFNAKHKKGVHTVDMDATSLKTAAFEGFDKFKNKQISITNTSMDPRNYAFIDVAIFIEGWDLSVVDEEQRHQFAMDLRFAADV